MISAAQLQTLAETARASGDPAIVLIDGGSGAGKTSLAHRLVPLLGRTAGEWAQLVSLDDVYPGWGGLEAGSRAVHEQVLRAHEPGWRRWDWMTEREAEWHPVDPTRPIVIEGCGALTARNRARATLGVWIELDADERRRRALARDGALFESYWDGWAAQEARLRAAEPPLELADVALDGR